MADDLDLMTMLDGGTWLSIVLATVAAFFIGFIWFTFIFGKRWADEMGMSMDEPQSFKQMAPSMAKDIVGHFLMAYVLFHVIAVWIPSIWAGHFTDMGWVGPAVTDAPMAMYGMYAAVFTWLGFFLPTALSRTGWEGRSWAWFGIDAGYTLVKLVVMAQIIAAFI